MKSSITRSKKGWFVFFQTGSVIIANWITTCFFYPPTFLTSFAPQATRWTFTRTLVYRRRYFVSFILSHILYTPGHPMNFQSRALMKVHLGSLRCKECEKRNGVRWNKMAARWTWASKHLWSSAGVACGTKDVKRSGEGKRENKIAALVDLSEEKQEWRGKR